MMAYDDETDEYRCDDCRVWFPFLAMAETDGDCICKACAADLMAPTRAERLNIRVDMAHDKEHN